MDVGSSSSWPGAGGDKYRIFKNAALGASGELYGIC